MAGVRGIRVAKEMRASHVDISDDSGSDNDGTVPLKKEVRIAPPPKHKNGAVDYSESVDGASSVEESDMAHVLKAFKSKKSDPKPNHVEVAADRHMQELERRRECEERERQEVARAKKHGVVGSSTLKLSSTSAAIAREWLDAYRSTRKSGSASKSKSSDRPVRKFNVVGKTVQQLNAEAQQLQQAIGALEAREAQSKEDMRELAAAQEEMVEKEKEFTQEMWQVRAAVFESQKEIDELESLRVSLEQSQHDLKEAIHRLHSEADDGVKRRDKIAALHVKVLADRQRLLDDEVIASAHKNEELTQEEENVTEESSVGRVGVAKDYDAQVTKRIIRLQAELDARAAAQQFKNETIQRLLKEKEENEGKELHLLQTIQGLLADIDKFGPEMQALTEKRDRMQRQVEEVKELTLCEQQQAIALEGEVAALRKAEEEVGVARHENLIRLRVKEKLLRSEHVDTKAEVEALTVSVLERQAIAAADRDAAERLVVLKASVQEGVNAMKQTLEPLREAVTRSRESEREAARRLEAIQDEHKNWLLRKNKTATVQHSLELLESMGGISKDNEEDVRALVKIRNEWRNGAQDQNYPRLTLADEISRLQKELETTASIEADLRRRTELLEVEFNECHRNESHQRTILEELQGQIKTARERAEETTVRVTEARAEATRLSAQSQAAENEALSLMAQSRADRQAIPGLLAKLKRLEVESAEAAETVAGVTEAMDKLNAELQELESQVKIDEEQFSRLAHQKTVSQQKANQVKTKTLEDKVAMEAMRTKQVEAEASIKKMEAQKVDMKAALARADEEQARCEKEEKELRAQLAEAEDKVMQRNDVIRTIKLDLREKESTAESLKKTASELQQKNMEVLSQIEQLKLAISAKMTTKIAVDVEQNPKLTALLKTLAPVNAESPLDRQHCAIFSRARQGYTNDVDKLLANGWVDANVVDEAGNTLLLIAAQLPSMELAKIALANGADINRCNARGNSCLHCCYAAGDRELTDFFLEHGADPTLKNALGLCYDEGFDLERPATRTNGVNA